MIDEAPLQALQQIMYRMVDLNPGPVTAQTPLGDPDDGGQPSWHKDGVSWDANANGQGEDVLWGKKKNITCHSGECNFFLHHPSLQGWPKPITRPPQAIETYLGQLRIVSSPPAGRPIYLGREIFLPPVICAWIDLWLTATVIEPVPNSLGGNRTNVENTFRNKVKYTFQNKVEYTFRPIVESVQLVLTSNIHFGIRSNIHFGLTSKVLSSS